MGEWDALADVAGAREVWQGDLRISDYPRLTLWWKAWQNLSGGQDILHVGVTCVMHVSDDSSEVGEGLEAAQKLLGGVVSLTWKTVGERLVWEVRPITDGKDGAWVRWTGRVTVRAYSGKELEPLMNAIQETYRAAKD